MSLLDLAFDAPNITQEYTGGGTGLPPPDEALLHLNMSREAEARDIPSFFHNRNSLLWSLLMSATMVTLEPGTVSENDTLPFSTTSVPGDPPGETGAASVGPVDDGVTPNAGTTLNSFPWKTTADLDPGGTMGDGTATEKSKAEDMSLIVTSQLLQVSGDDRAAATSPTLDVPDLDATTVPVTENTFQGSRQPAPSEESKNSEADVGSPPRNQATSEDGLQESLIDAPPNEASNGSQVDIENKNYLDLSNNLLITQMPLSNLTQLMASSVNENVAATSAQSDATSAPETSVANTTTEVVETAEDNSVPLRIVNEPSTPSKHGHDPLLITQGSSIPESRTSQTADTGSEYPETLSLTPDDTLSTKLNGAPQPNRGEPEKVVSQPQVIGRPDVDEPPVWGTSAESQQVRTALPHSLDVVIVEAHTHQTASKPSGLSKNSALSQVHQTFQNSVPETHGLGVLEEQQVFQTFKPVSQSISLKTQQPVSHTEVSSSLEEGSLPETEVDDGDIFQNISDTLLSETNSNYSNATTLEEESAGLGGINWTASRITLFIIQFVIMVETVLGNLMVILSVKMEKKLQTPFNYYIVNLAFTDMNVGLSVMSLFMIYNLYDYFPFGSFLCNYWIWSDYVMTFESVMTLAAIRSGPVLFQRDSLESVDLYQFHSVFSMELKTVDGH